MVFRSYFFKNYDVIFIYTNFIDCFTRNDELTHPLSYAILQPLVSVRIF